MKPKARATRLQKIHANKHKKLSFLDASHRQSHAPMSVSSIPLLLFHTTLHFRYFTTNVESYVANSQRQRQKNTNNTQRRAALKLFFHDQLCAMESRYLTVSREIPTGGTLPPRWSSRLLEAEPPEFSSLLDSKIFDPSDDVKISHPF